MIKGWKWEPILNMVDYAVAFGYPWEGEGGNIEAKKSY